MSALAPDRARIGPNAILQHLPVLDAAIGEALRGALFAPRGRRKEPPPCMLACCQRIDGRGAPATMRCACSCPKPAAPGDCKRAAGVGGRAIKYFGPPHSKARASGLNFRRLAQSAFWCALAGHGYHEHAWTLLCFCRWGSGVFRVLAYGPLRCGNSATTPLAIARPINPICDWQTPAVFERACSARLVWPDVQVVEEDCTAMGATACIFRIAPR